MDGNRINPKREITRSKARIKKLEKEKDKLIHALGIKAWETYKEGNLSENSLSEILSQIESIESEISNCNTYIQEMQAQILMPKAAPFTQTATFICPFCQTPTIPGMRFCGNCGKELISPQPTAGSNCPSCGTPYSAGDRFCSNCGAAIVTEKQVVVPPPPVDAKAQVPAENLVATAPKTCPSCGAQSEADAVFCGECGARL